MISGKIMQYVYSIVLLVHYCLGIFSLNSYQLESCHINGRPHHCMPPFINIVEKMNPIIDCGHSCTVNRENMDLLTDYHVVSNNTCWNSGIIPSNYLNITFSFKKRFEIYYISLSPCITDVPDAVAFYKSTDFGQTWNSWQFFAKNCKEAFRMVEDNPKIRTVPLNDELNRTKCYSMRLSEFSKEPVIAFNLPWRRPYSPYLDNELTNWMTASDIKISLYKIGERRNVSSSPYFNNNNKISNSFTIADISVGGRCKCNGHANSCTRDKEKDTLLCRCQHNTQGQDCEQCKEGYLDMPWKRATVARASVCKKCNCNLHSSKCVFSGSLHRKSNRRSGGICVSCLHNTAGTNCHYCQVGYFRDWTKPLDHKFVCRKCRCHPIGSKFRNKCDRRTGQCFCKSGVTGERCNRCKPGYSQTRSTNQPCVKTLQMESARKKKCPPCSSRRSRIRFKKFCRKDAVFLATLQSHEVIGDKIRFDIRMENEWHHQIDLESAYPDVWGPNGVAKIRSSSVDRASDSSSVNANVAAANPSLTIPLWMRVQDAQCSCDSLILGQSYLFIVKLIPYRRSMPPTSRSISSSSSAAATTYSTNYFPPEMMLKASRSVILHWRSSWQRRLSKFSRRKSRGNCDRYTKRRRRRKSRRKDLRNLKFSRRSWSSNSRWWRDS